MHISLGSWEAQARVRKRGMIFRFGVQLVSGNKSIHERLRLDSDQIKSELCTDVSPASQYTFLTDGQFIHTKGELNISGMGSHLLLSPFLLSVFNPPKRATATVHNPKGCEDLCNEYTKFHFPQNYVSLISIESILTLCYLLEYTHNCFNYCSILARQAQLKSY